MEIKEINKISNKSWKVKVYQDHKLFRTHHKIRTFMEAKFIAQENALIKGRRCEIIEVYMVATHEYSFS